MLDPVFYLAAQKINEGSGAIMPIGWYFYDETWADVVGPYETEEYARFELSRYVKWLDGGIMAVDPYTDEEIAKYGIDPETAKDQAAWIEQQRDRLAHEAAVVEAVIIP